LSVCASGRNTISTEVMCFELQWFELGRNIQDLKQRIEKSSKTANSTLRGRLDRLNMDVKRYEQSVACPLDDRYADYCKKYLMLLSVYKKIVLSCM
jgi:hypothetical protein